MSEEFTRFFGIPLEVFGTGITDAETYNKAMELLDEILNEVAGEYAGSFSQASKPGSGQIPDGKWGIWVDTDNGDAITFLFNNGGTFSSIPAYREGDAVTFGIMDLVGSPQSTSSDTFVFLARQYVDASRFRTLSLTKEFFLRANALVSAAGVEGEVRLYDVTNAQQLAIIIYTEEVATLKAADGASNLPASGLIEVECQYRRSVGGGGQSFTVNFACIDFAMKIP
jgi:hypothetical protein